MPKFRVWALDMWQDPDGAWGQNDRSEVGMIECEEEPKEIVLALYDARYLLTKDGRRVFVDDRYCAGSTYEVCARKSGEPLFSLEKEEEDNEL